MGTRKYKLDESFFDKWTNESAYVLGWIYTDGNLSKSRPRMKICCCDKDIIVTISKLIGSTHPIYEHTPKNRTRPQFTLVVDSQKIYDRLIEIGLTPSKSKTTTVPNVPQKYFSHFLRGVIDGDGSVYLEPQKYRDRDYSFLRLTVVSGSIEFLHVLQEKIGNSYGVKEKIMSKNKTAFQLKYSTNEALKVLSHVYKDSSFGRLERKYEKYNIFNSIWAREHSKK